MPDAEAATLLTLLGCRAQRGSAVCSGALPTKAGVAGKGYVHLLVNHTNGDYAPNCGAHIHGWEGFWGRLKRQLATKGGIRRSQLPLYFAEYVWRYTHRGDSRTAQITRLQLLRSSGS